MNLFLSSENVGNYPEVFLSLMNGKRLAYVAHAKDDASDLERQIQVAQHKAQFESYGLEFTEIDLRKFFNQKVPSDILDNFDGVWCPGGNTFLLRAAMKKSGFDDVLISKIKKGLITYGGSSAGSVVVGPSLHGTENGDDPDAVQISYKSNVVWDGLGVVDFVTIPHVGSDWFGDEAQKMKESLISNNVPYREVKDGQVVLIKDGVEEFLP